jgi:hypothetical protein
MHYTVMSTRARRPTDLPPHSLPIEPRVGDAQQRPRRCIPAIALIRNNRNVRWAHQQGSPSRASTTGRPNARHLTSQYPPGSSSLARQALIWYVAVSAISPFFGGGNKGANVYQADATTHRHTSRHAETKTPRLPGPASVAFMGLGAFGRATYH